MADPVTITARPAKGCESPFAWQAKRALSRIRDGKGKTSLVILRSVYLALTEIASDEKSPAFAHHKSYIAKRAGLGVRKVADALYDLEACGVLSINRRRIEGKTANELNEYTLCSVRTTPHAPDAQAANAPDAQGSCTGAVTPGARKKNNTPLGVYKKELVAEASERLALSGFD